MLLYSGSSKQFISDATQNIIADKLQKAFYDNFYYQTPEAEVRSWKNSLRAMKDVIQEAGLDDHGIIIEYQLPMTSLRLDFMICGKDSNQKDNAVIVELKQWDKCDKTESESCVLTWVGQGYREVPHPSVQVEKYTMYLKDTHTAFYEGDSPISLSGCAYLHNYSPIVNDHLYSKKFEKVLKYYPSFNQKDFERIKSFISKDLKGGEGEKILPRIEKSKYKPSKQLLEHIAGIVKGLPEYILLDDQLVAYERVCVCAEQALKSKGKQVILVRGGPGTGKSVIALNLLGTLSLKGFNTHYVTGSRAFTATLKEILGTRGAQQVKQFSSYMAEDSDTVDVMICDEAHRMWIKSKNRFIRREMQSGLLQIEELFRSAKVSVFFIDDKQVVRPEEIGSSDYVLKAAREKGYNIYDYKLTAQFRCLGSDAFINWISNTLQVEETPEVIWDINQSFDFRIMDSVFDLDKIIKEKNQETKKARLVAGFCWPWSDPTGEGHLIDDVEIGQFKRPWNAKTEKRLANGIPKASLWAYDPRGIDQIGCIYTAQGFEFDYVGVIFGKDLVYRKDRGWIGDPDCSEDPVVSRSKDKFIDLVKNTYRVLLTRGLKGCYVYFQDKETEKYFKSRVRNAVN